MDSVDDARAWADRLGLPIEQKIDSYRYGDGGESVYEACHAEGQVDGVHIDVVGTRSVKGAEADAWLAAQLEAGKDTRDAGDVHSADDTAGGTGE